MPDDYRASHLHRGSDYDQSLASDPLDAYMDREEQRLLPPILRSLFPGRAARGLDFACGTGRVTSILESAVGQCYGLDISESMLSRARDRCPRTHFILSDGTESGPEVLRVEPVDVVTAFRFFGNADEHLRVASLDTIRELLIPGGYLVLNNHRNPYGLGNLVARLKGGAIVPSISHRHLRRLLHHAGFHHERSYGIGAWILRAKWCTNEVLQSRAARILEPLSRLPGAAAISPDAIIVARRH